MKKVIGIYYDSKFEESSFETGCGGSDTWVIQISKEFTRRGYHVIVFNNCDNWTIGESMVEYVPCSLFEMRCDYQHFDYFIMTRLFNEDLYNIIVSTGCKNIYLQSHDMFIWNKNLYDERYIYEHDKYPYLKKYIGLTNFHKNNLCEYNLIPSDKIEIIGNGVDSDIFDKVDKESIIKDNSILFPTVYSRGGDILVENILPLVLKEIPDFEVHLCGYHQSFPEHVYNNPHVQILGMLNKEDFYREFRKHKVWFLPCTVSEDFGLCACEAVMCECDVVSPFEHGMKDVCSPFVNLKMNNKFKVLETHEYHYSQYKLNMFQEDFDRTCSEATGMIIDSIKNYYLPDRIRLRQSFKNYILQTHNWKNVVDKWEKLFKLSELGQF